MNSIHDFQRTPPAARSSAPPPAPSARPLSAPCSATATSLALALGCHWLRQCLSSPAPLRPQGQARPLPVPIRRLLARRPVRPQAHARQTPRQRNSAVGERQPAAHRHDLRPGASIRSSPRCGPAGAAASTARGSATCCRTCKPSPTTSASSSRCTPRRSTTTRPSRS